MNHLGALARKDHKAMNDIPKAIIFSDLDGTLLHSGRISAENRAAIAYCRASGIPAVLNTGRSKAFLPSRAYSVEWDGMICGTAYCEFGGEVLMNDGVPADDLVYVARYCIDNNIPVKFEGVSEVMSINESGAHRDISEDYADLLPQMPDISKVTVGMPISDSDAVLFGKRFDIVRLPTYTELLQRGKTKALGMELICRRAGIPREAAVAFGDSMNDTAMLEWAGTAVIMKNADERLDSLAAFRTDSDSKGVAEGLRRIFGF